MPFNTPYGPPISLQRAQSAISTALGEANRRGWQLNIAVVDSGANLVAFVRMDGAQLASIAIAEHKARTSVKYRRPTKAFEDAIQKSGFNYILTLDDVIASRGGIPLVDEARLSVASVAPAAPVHRTRRCAQLVPLPLTGSGFRVACSPRCAFPCTMVGPSGASAP